MFDYYPLNRNDGNHSLNHRDNSFIVFAIGDDYSGVCPILAKDILDLQTYFLVCFNPAIKLTCYKGNL